MIQRIWTIASYLLYRLLRSLAGLAYIALMLAYYFFAFSTRTPEADYFILVIGLFGALVTFFATLSVASNANESKSYPIFVRLESRVEFLVAVLAAALLYGLALQLIMAGLALARNEPQMQLSRLYEIPPLWLSLNILSAVLALQASDFVAKNWSRVYVFGVLAAFVFMGDSYPAMAAWIEGSVREVGREFAREGLQSRAENWYMVADWFTVSATETVSGFFRVLLWPFEAIIDAVLAGTFTQAQALAPAVLLLFATLLFVLAAEFFATKDLFLRED